MSFAIPVNDPRYAELAEDLRTLVAARLLALEQIASAPRLYPALRAVALEHAGERGWGLVNLRALWYEFRRSGGDWVCLVDRSRAGLKWFHGLGKQGLPGGFVEHLGQLWVRNQRDKFRPVWKQLKLQYAQWRAGADCPIPGYERCPEPLPGTGLPRGWSYSHLKRVAEKVASDYARKLVQVGPKSASEFKPPVLTTRAGLMPGQFYVFDDSWNDFKVLFRGRPVRLLSLHALDLASGCNLIRGYKPAVEDERGIEERLKEREMIYLLACLFTTIGFHAEGSTLLCEKGTATIRPREEELLDQLTQGGIVVERGPRGGGPGVGGLFTGYGGGNFRWKAPLESWFNLLRNSAADLLTFPGQTGSYSSGHPMPEGLDKIGAHDHALARAAQLLPPERAELLRFNLLSCRDAILALEAVTECINTRRDHALEGWRASGHFVPAFRLAPQLPWIRAEELLKLEPTHREQLRVLLAADPDLTGEIALSPREVFEQGRPALRKFTASQTALLLCEAPGDERTVSQGLLECNVPDVNPEEPLYFGPLLRDCNGREEPLQNGEKYLVRVNPYAPDFAFLYTAAGGFCGYCRAWGRVGRANQEALQRRFADKNKAVAAWTRDARRLAAPLTQRAAESAGANLDVIEDTAERRKLRRFEGDLSEALEGSAESGERREDHLPSPLSPLPSALSPLPAELSVTTRVPAVVGRASAAVAERVTKAEALLTVEPAAAITAPAISQAAPASDPSDPSYLSDQTDDFSAEALL